MRLPMPPTLLGRDRCGGRARAPAQSHGWHVHRSRAATAAVASTWVRAAAAAAAPTRAREDMPFAGLLLRPLVHVRAVLLLAIVIIVVVTCNACACLSCDVVWGGSVWGLPGVVFFCQQPRAVTSSFASRGNFRARKFRASPESLTFLTHHVLSLLSLCSRALLGVSPLLDRLLPGRRWATPPLRIIDIPAVVPRPPLHHRGFDSPGYDSFGPGREIPIFAI